MTERLDDMLIRYGEVCTQKHAAHILGVTPRTISRMMDDGRLWRVGMHVDVRSICAYIENPAHADFDTRIRSKYPKNLMGHGEFYTASRTVKRRKGA